MLGTITGDIVGSTYEYEWVPKEIAAQTLALLPQEFRDVVVRVAIRHAELRKG